MARKIKTKFDSLFSAQHGELGGWLKREQTYLWFGVSGHCEGVLSGYKLLRLARAIVKQMEKH